MRIMKGMVSWHTTLAGSVRRLSCYNEVVSNEDFIAWVNSQLRARDWSLRKLSREAGIHHGTISRVLSGHNIPGHDFCDGLAHAFGMASEEVYRLAGLLQSVPDDAAIAESALYLFRRLTVADQERILAMMRALAELSESEKEG